MGQGGRIKGNDGNMREGIREGFLFGDNTSFYERFFEMFEFLKNFNRYF